MSKILVDTIDTRSGTSNITIGSSNASQITLKSGATLTNLPDNTPAFYAYGTNNQQIPNTTYTKVVFVNEFYDTDSAFDTSTYRFTVPSGKAGNYFFTYNIRTEAAFEDEERLIVKIYKNGSAYEYGTSDTRSSKSSMNMQKALSVTMNLVAGDYVEVYSYHDEGANVQYEQGNCFFSGCRLIT